MYAAFHILCDSIKGRDPDRLDFTARYMSKIQD